MMVVVVVVVDSGDVHCTASTVLNGAMVQCCAQCLGEDEHDD